MSNFFDFEVRLEFRGNTYANSPSRLCLGLFLATVESSITATALVSIGEYFDDSFTVCLPTSPCFRPRLTLNLDDLGCTWLFTFLYG